MIVNALAVGAAATAGAGIALLISYTLGRLALDRRRLAAWESAWSLTEPRWTTRR
jgi:membrane protein DedA with SNARE-associated domain